MGKTHKANRKTRRKYKKKFKKGGSSEARKTASKTDKKERADKYKTMKGDNYEEYRTMKKGHYDKFNKKTPKSFRNSYLETYDPEYLKMMAKKKEFYENKHLEMTDRCDIDKFQLTPQQQLLSNFMSPNTIYKSLLLFHGTGSGKTCSAINITENFTEQTEKLDKIIIICGKSVTENFYKNLFDETTIQGKNVDYQCTGRKYYDMVDTTLYKNKPNKMYKQIRKRIDEYYDVTTYYKFATRYNVHNRDNNRTTELPFYKKVKTGDEVMYKKIRNPQEHKNYILNSFSNRVIVIDEIQALRDESSLDSKQGKLITNILMDIARYSNNTRFVLLSATPMFNEAIEIIWLLNLMRVNDNKHPIEEAEFFIDNVLIENKEDELKEYMKGYISYVRGEDPFNFPLRMYPHDDKGKDSKEVIKLEKPPEHDFFGNKIEGDNDINKLKLYCVESKKDQKRALMVKQGSFKKRINISLEERSVLKQMSLIVYPDGDYGSISKAMNTNDISQRTFIGKQKKYTQYSYKDTDEDQFLKWKPVDERSDGPQDTMLENYSIKFAETLSCIDRFLKSDNDGIIFVYMYEVEAGIIPFCLALEQYGMTKYDDTNLLNKSGLDWTPRSYKGELYERGNATFVPGKYVIATGDNRFPLNQTEINVSKSRANKDGSKVRVIVGSDVMSEGIDLKYIREIHILEPWFHLNKTEQIIGRGIRFCSHSDMDEKERNVTVYLHVIAPQKVDKVVRDSFDIFTYKKALDKAKQIGKIEKAMKESAIDCQLLKKSNLLDIKSEAYTSKFDDSYTIKTASGKFPYKPKEIPYSKICSYEAECNYTCLEPEDIDTPDFRKNLNNSTYSLKKHNNHKIRNCKNIIKEYFKKEVVISKEALTEYIKGKIKIPDKIIDYSLNDIVQKRIEIRNRNNKGYIVKKNNYYVFEQKFKEDEPLQLRKHRTHRKEHRKSIRFMDVGKYNCDDITTEEILGMVDVGTDHKYIEDLLPDFTQKIQNKIPTIKLKMKIDNLKYACLIKLLPYLYYYHSSVNNATAYEYLKNSFYKGKNDKVYVVLFNDGNELGIFEIKKGKPIHERVDAVTEDKDPIKYNRILHEMSSRITSPFNKEYYGWNKKNKTMVSQYKGKTGKDFFDFIKPFIQEHGELNPEINKKISKPYKQNRDITDMLRSYPELLFRILDEVSGQKYWLNRFEYGMWNMDK